ncbi:MAG: hypothetical protein O7B79_05290 [SAR324 cluster bacterium]|nr:hypothetical protein [SAR324 cluster bacterium]
MKPILFWVTVLLACLLALPGVAAAVEVGQRAPGFDLIATTGGKISLKQYRGKQNVLIEFIVADFGPV